MDADEFIINVIAKKNNGTIELSVPDDVFNQAERILLKNEQCVYEEEKLDVRWFCAKDVTPPVPEYGMCSEDVIVKYKDGTESVACITFNGVWYDTDYNEVADAIVYWRYMTDDEKPD